MFVALLRHGPHDAVAAPFNLRAGFAPAHACVFDSTGQRL